MKIESIDGSDGVSAHHVVHMMKKFEEVTDAIEDSIFVDQFGKLKARVNVYDDQLIYYVFAGAEIFVVTVTETDQYDCKISCDRAKRDPRDNDCFVELETEIEFLREATFEVIFRCLEAAQLAQAS
jgi:hypothetical protein